VLRQEVKKCGQNHEMNAITVFLVLGYFSSKFAETEGTKKA
jgi:hypothetical protein